MKRALRILVIGTADTKSAEILFLRERIECMGAEAWVLDVGVLGQPSFVPEISNAEVAAAADSALEEIRALGDESAAIQTMALGAARLTHRLQEEGQIDGMIALGGTMGTDLALDVAAVLPLGFPKVLLSTIAHSHLLPPQRIPADLISVLWAGGLYGLNTLCKSALSQAAGAVVGACQATIPPLFERPLIGMTSLGSSVLRYMKTLLPALEQRGYEVAVFHTAGMGGQVFEALAARGRFAAIFDFSLQELANAQLGSCVTAGPDRLLGAGRSGTAQLVAPGAVDMVDFQAWQPVPPGTEAGTVHLHNRLVGSVSTTVPQRQALAREIGRRLAQAQGPVCLLLPTEGGSEWDRQGAPMHDAMAQRAFVDALRGAATAPVRLVEIPAHINDAAFCHMALQVFDQWVEDGLVVRGNSDHPREA